MEKQVFTTVGVGITGTLGIFIQSSLSEIVVWLTVMFMVILTDLMSGIYRSYRREDEKVRISKGIRDTMAKVAVYFSFVVAAVFFQNAGGFPNAAKWSCVLVCAGEAISIFGNILKAHGYKLDTKEVISAIADKLHMSKDVIKKEDE